MDACGLGDVPDSQFAKYLVACSQLHIFLQGLHSARLQVRVHFATSHCRGVALWLHFREDFVKLCVLAIRVALATLSSGFWAIRESSWFFADWVDLLRVHGGARSAPELLI